MRFLTIQHNLSKKSIYLRKVSAMATQKKYNPYEREQIVKSICEDVINNKLSFTQAVKKSPITFVSFFNWVTESEELRNLYHYAREIRSDILFEEIIDIADTPQEGETIKEDKNGKTIEKGDMLGHRRLQIDARKWVVAKMQPKKYGEKLDITTDGQSINAPISPAELQAAKEKFKDEL